MKPSALCLWHVIFRTCLVIWLVSAIFGKVYFISEFWGRTCLTGHRLGMVTIWDHTIIDSTISTKQFVVSCLQLSEEPPCMASSLAAVQTNSLKHLSKLTFNVKRGSNSSLDDCSKWLADFVRLLSPDCHSSLLSNCYYNKLCSLFYLSSVW